MKTMRENEKIGDNSTCWNMRAMKKLTLNRSWEFLLREKLGGESRKNQTGGRAGSGRCRGEGGCQAKQYRKK